MVNKICFIQIPRTASTTLGRYFTKHNQHNITIVGHLDIDHNKTPKIYNLNLDEYFVVAFVRNPWDFWVSNFFIHQQGQHLPHNTTQYNNTNSFFEFIQTVYDRIFTTHQKETFSLSGYFNRLCYFRDTYIDDPDITINPEGQFIVDFIGRFETLYEDLEKIQFLTNIRMPKQNELPIIGKTNRKHYSHYYNDTTIEMVKKIEWPIIKMFNYDFQKED